MSSRVPDRGLSNEQNMGSPSKRGKHVQLISPMLSTRAPTVPFPINARASDAGDGIDLHPQPPRSDPAGASHTNERPRRPVSTQLRRSLSICDGLAMQPAIGV